MENITTNKTLERFQNTPVIQDLEGFMDADDELMPVAEYVKQTTVHNADIDVKRIKFLYTDAIKKVSGRFAVLNLFDRKPMEKMINDEYDFIITVAYDIWKELEGEQMVIQVDKVLCGIDTGSMEKPKLSKKQPDSKEFLDNMNHFTPRRVMEVSQIVHMTGDRILEERKENSKNS